LKNRVVLCAASAATFSLCSYTLFRVAFLGYSVNLSPFEALAIAVAGLFTGLTLADLKRSLLVFYSIYLASYVTALTLLRYPLDTMMGGFSGDLATIVVTRNIGFFSLIVGGPLSILTLIIGVSISSRLKSMYVSLTLSILLILLSSTMLTVEYSDWYGEVRSLKGFRVNTVYMRLSLKEELDGARPVLELKVSMETVEGKPACIVTAIYRVFLDGKLVREKVDAMPGEGLLVGSQPVYRKLDIELPKTVPLDCLERKRCRIEVQVNFKTRFGVIPVKYSLNYSLSTIFIPLVYFEASPGIGA